MVRHKFNARKTEVDGIKFHSKKEAEYYEHLKEKIADGELLFFLRQAPLHLPGNIKYYVDFVEFWANGEVIFTDVKGYETKEFRMKKKMVESFYPIKINVVKEF